MDQATTLLELQATDVEIIRARKRLDELPEKRAILAARAKLRETTDLKSKADLLIRKLEAEVKKRADEIETCRAKIEAEQKRVLETTDHRAVQAITREMDGLRRRCDKLEMESLQFMERVERAGAQRATIEESVSTQTAHEAGLVARFRTVGAELQTEIDALDISRAKLAKSLDADLLARYESLRETKGGIGVGRLENKTCSACHMTLPEERLRDLMAGPEVGICPQCRRLIVVRAEEA